jgi:hypothetical protein
MKEFIITYWLEAIFSLIIAGLTLCFKSLYKKVHKQLDDQKSLKDGTQALLRGEIIRSYDKYIEKGWIPIYAREGLTSMYNAYHNLGGNGTITRLMDELNELPSSPLS